MGYFSWLLSGAVALVLGVAPAIAASPAEAVAPSGTIPPFADVQKMVLKYFKAIPDYRAGDLITQDQVAPLLKQVQKKGLPLPDAAKILKRVPVKGEFLVEQLSTPDGREFMRRVAKYPDGFDRVDRLSRMVNGRQLVRDLIRGPRGDLLIDYMTTTKGGENMGKDLEADPNGEDFNSPTGRIYTAAQLIARLRQSYAAAVKAAERSEKQ